MVLYLELAPPINPFACTKSISLICDIFTNFSISFIPLHYYFKPFLNTNDPSATETA